MKPGPELAAVMQRGPQAPGGWLHCGQMGGYCFPTSTLGPLMPVEDPCQIMMSSRRAMTPLVGQLRFCALRQTAERTLAELSKALQPPDPYGVRKAATQAVNMMPGSPLALLGSQITRSLTWFALQLKWVSLESVQAHVLGGGEQFNLRMKRDTTMFSHDFKLEMSGEETNYDTSHIYTGEIFGEQGSLSHGSIVDGKFEGFIQTRQGTYYVEPTERYMKDRDVPFHSVIYHEDDIHYPHKYGPEGGCADHSVFERMKKYQASAMEEPAKETNEVMEEEQSDGPVLLRKRRAAQVEKNTCQLFIQTDHLFYKYYGTREAVIAQINTTSDERDKSNPFRFANIGVEKFLELNSEQNHDDYCLAYVFTDRDFDDGVLGLAWVGAPAGSSGGICEKSKLYSDGKKKSLNTGIITVQNYASHVPPKVSHITFAHEVGHNFGSPHDSGIECTPGESKSQDLKEKGNYIMYARATSGDKLNNNKFSICSVRNISQSGQPICGNGLVEVGEECDCGYSDQCKDQCCYDANQPDGKKCKLRPNKLPSQGPCCTADCTFKNRNEKCREESECAHQGMCSGGPPLRPLHLADGGPAVIHTPAQTPDGPESSAMCHFHFMLWVSMKPNTCSSTGSEKWARFFNKKITTLQPGSPCNDFKGYCDVFMKCRLVDADGPLARLKKAIFNPELYENIAEWIAHWWAVLLMGIALIMLMAGFIKICSVHTPSSNPKLPPPKPLPGTLKRRRPQHTNPQPQQQRHHHRQPRENYQMGQMRR
ncbi:hypothetical protein JZ751_020600 [Albula glossodonta]|uniref:Disintegrin and metalloproteinase domain-containing protein 10 n=1 Tax=Albula glossodonta TaxID=121402 RepID=A0A8T2PNN4_9TELE|nr:hypothetical protein JZ751_020600 [Albula glossodonta]